jgi:hypothetical protein
MLINSWALSRHRVPLSSSALTNVSDTLQSPTPSLVLISHTDVSAVMNVNEYLEIGKFFGGFLKPQL